VRVHIHNRCHHLVGLVLVGLALALADSDMNQLAPQKHFGSLHIRLQNFS
jgi:hypothetical protein